MSYEKNIALLEEEIVVSFDLEWTKNYRIKNGNQPFCFSFVFFPVNVSLKAVEKTLDFGFYLRYVESKDDISVLINEANKILGDFLARQGKVTIVGHQLSSDISVIINCICDGEKNHFSQLKTSWQLRKNIGGEEKNIKVFDSRYDLGAFLKGKSRRLVDVCGECHLGVSQPELIYSMTKMQNDFYVSGDKQIMEKLSVLNIRHSLSAAILFIAQHENRRAKGAINVNRILHRNLTNHFDYVNGDAFKELL